MKIKIQTGFFTKGKNPFRILVVSLKLKKTGILSKQ